MSPAPRSSTSRARGWALHVSALRRQHRRPVVFLDTRARIEERRRKYECRRDPSEGGSQRCRILHAGDSDLTTECRPFLTLAGVAQDRADATALGQQGTRKRAADLSQKSRLLTIIISYAALVALLLGN